MFDAKVDENVYAHMQDISGLIGHYAHRNEPSYQVAYLYNYAGAPWKTQGRLSQIVASQYNTTPAGLTGNDDLGQMSVGKARGAAAWGQRLLAPEAGMPIKPLHTAAV